MRNDAMIGRTTSGGDGWRNRQARLALAMVNEFSNVGDEV